MFLIYRAPFQQINLEKAHEALPLLVCTGDAIIIALQQVVASIIGTYTYSHCPVYV